jgi:hypothetical protein
VQGWIVDDPAARDDKSYEAVTYYACRRVHMVDPKTRKVMGEDQDE